MSAAIIEENIAMRSLTTSESQPAISTNSGLNQTNTVAHGNVVDQEDVPPDGGYGWVVCLCVFLINAHTWGVNSVFLPKTF